MVLRFVSSTCVLLRTRVEGPQLSEAIEMTCYLEELAKALSSTQMRFGCHSFSSRTDKPQIGGKGVID